ncbi:MAG: hypothetical protein M3Q56_01300 [Bacteroidota bacterium]|nr:hypothetical protein [Bacteroidota bacterium]
MKRILIYFLLFYSQTVVGQSFGTLYFDFPQKYAEKDLDKKIKKGQNNKSITFSSKNKVGDTLSYFIQTNVECFTTKMTFNFKNKDLDEKTCDFLEYIFDCQTCSKQHLEEFISMYKFRPKTENTYLSSYSNKVEMTIQYDTNPLNLIFRRVDLDKKTYKELYKSLKKKQR